MLTLLEKTRTLNKLLQKNKEVTVDFSEIAQVLSEMIDCKVYIISRTGKMLGDAFIAGFNCATVDNILNDNGLMPEEYNEMLLRTSQTSANILGDKNQCVFDGRHCDLGGKISTIVPITGGGERQGTLLLAKFENEFDDEDLILAEYGATIVGMEIIRSKSDKIEEEARKKAEAAGKKVSATDKAASYNVASLGNISFKWPCPSSSRISSGFGGRTSPTKGASSNHQGIDIPASTGAAITAAASGTVVVSTYSYSAGNYIMISHGGGVYTVYMHCSQLLASEGQTVKQGQTIAKVGSTGYSTGSHLHFGIRSGAR